MSEPADSRPPGHPATVAGVDRVCGGGRLRLRPWQRLRGQRAFQRVRGIGVYRHSGAALIRIMPLWELEALDLDCEQDRADLPNPPDGSAAQTGGGAVGSGKRGAAKRLSIAAVRGMARDSGATGGQSVGTGDGAPLRRLGIVASRKVGNAVVRNRAKRWFREIFRHSQHDLPPHCDVLVIVRNGFRDASLGELQAQFADVIRRAQREAQRPRRSA